MAEGPIPMAPAPANGAEALREILEYEKIVQFKDAVLAGTHPRIKIPAHLAGKQPINSLRNISSPNSTTPRPNLNPTPTPNPQPPAHETPGSRAEVSSSFYNISSNKARAAGGAHIPSRSEINPILLEKSDDLIKAEMQLQRQRLEKGLREQIEQQRMASRSLMQTSESLPNFDISEVLSKALAIVHPSTTTTTEAEPADPSGDATDDSFDNNTFYTSEHGTPGPPSPAQGENISAEMQSHSALSLEQRGLPVQVEDRAVVMTGTSLSNDNNTGTQTRPQMHSQNSTPNRHEQLLQTGNSGSSSSSGEIVSSNAQGAVKATTHDLLKQALDKVATSPLIRNHNLSPIAPQPARVSPLATARDPPIHRQNAPVEEIQPFQVSALRSQQNGNSSTENSPKDVKERKREKRKEKRKRKGKEAATTPESPYIKPEPRSPSPFTAVAPLPRPQKRQRQSGQFAPELNYDELRHEHVGGDVEHRAPEEPFREARAPRTYERIPERYGSEIRRPEPVYRRIEEDDFRPVAHSQYERRPPASEYVALPHVYSESRSTASYAPVERRTVEPAFKEIDLTQPVIGGNELSERIYRASVRPGADRDRSRSPVYRERRSPMAMAPPRHPMRIIVDEFGRKYYEPVPALRQSIAPPTSYREASVIYERPPIRAVSSRVPAEYEREAVIYRTSSPPFQRRVVTQPDYAIPAQPDYREYRQREYSIRPTPMGPPGPEYVQVRGRPITPVEDMRREYVQRAPSAYPEVRYEIPREYARVQSVRAEAPPREYAASVRPEARREMAPPQAQREYSVRPADGIPVPRRQILAEGERYYEQDLLRRPAEVAYIERPRAREGSVVVYADDVRREIYR